MDQIAEFGTRLVPISDHFDGRHFFNPHVPTGRTRREEQQLQRTRREPWPEHVGDPLFPRPGYTAHDRLSVTFIGHSTFLLQIGGKREFRCTRWRVRPAEGR